MMEEPKGDYLLIVYYGMGILLGCIIIYFLPTNEEELERLKSASTSTPTRLEEEQEAVGRAKSELKKGSSAWDGDDIPEEELERIRKRFRLTHEQMYQVLEMSKEEATMNKRSHLTPHQRMNRMVYIIMISALLYVLNRDYGNVVLIWFVQMFPTEARVLGLIKPSASE